MSGQPSLSEQIDFAKTILAHNQSLVNFADTKAGVILAVDGAILAILASTSASISSGLAQLAAGAALLLIGISAILGFLIIKPRIHAGAPNTKVFYKAILAQSKEDYKKSFSSTPQQILDDYLNNIYTLALIQEKKFFYLQESLYCLILGLVPLGAIIVVLH
ncbi:MAG: DUF5706 domain-containing protein [Thaumarchaeota archaeon]|nr:DUF5706 domain-containing protein [Nitrososphaerota archaeon]